jgi:hypothetical protein
LTSTQVGLVRVEDGVDAPPRPDLFSTDFTGNKQGTRIEVMHVLMRKLVGVERFELPTPSSRTTVLYVCFMFVRAYALVLFAVGADEAPC